MITFGQTSMKRDGWTTGLPLNTEFVTGTIPAQMCGPSGHTPGTHIHTLLSIANGLSASDLCLIHTASLSFAPSFHMLLIVEILLSSCPGATHNCCLVSLRTHPACFENVRECMREDGEGRKKKLVQLQEPERSQEQHPIPERFPWRQGWQCTMRTRESDEREGERERAGEE